MTTTPTPRSPDNPLRAGGEATEATPGGRAWSAGHVIIAVVVALIVGAVLNARDLQATAERQPFGWQRDLALAFANPLVSVADAVGLDEPRNVLNQAIGRDSLQADDEPVVVEPTPTPSPTSTPTASETPTAEPTPTETERLISAAEPLRMYIGGDSLVEIQFAPAMADLADDTGVIAVEQIDFDRGSGLARPDFIDWPARLRGVTEDLAPEVMVLWFGGNDAQPLKIDGTVYDVLDQEWQDEYRSRVSDLMDQLDEAGTTVFWMGLPIPRDTELQAKWEVLDEIFRSEAEPHEAIFHVPVWDEFAGPDGKYAEFLPNRNGDVVDMRLNDGIHLTTAGAYKAARIVMPLLIAHYGIEPEVDEGG